MKGTLDGIESSWDSPGLGSHQVTFDREPIVGERFRCNGLTLPYGGLLTSTVQRLARVEDEIRFNTRNTTYLLREEKP